MRIQIAGITCEFNIDADWLTREAEQRYRPFLTSNRADFTFAVTTNAKGFQTIQLTDGCIAYREIAISIRKDGDLCHLEREDFPFESDIDLLSGIGKVTVASNLRCFDSFLRTIYSLLLAYNDGALLHSAAVKAGDAGWVFTGPSGSGKSTIASLSSDTVLSDELTAIRRINGEYWVFSTPFWGGYTPGMINDSAQIATIFILAHDLQDYTKQLGGVKAAQGIIRNALFFGPEECVVPLFEFCLDLVCAVPVKELRFRPSSEVFNVVKKGSVCSVG